jgi:hypothetical protein
MRRGKKTPENSTKIVWHNFSTGSLAKEDRKNIATDT